MRLDDLFRILLIGMYTFRRISILNVANVLHVNFVGYNQLFKILD